IIFKRCKGYIIVFDEFQNFYTIDKSVFSIMQKNCDEHKTTPLNIIILGSLIGLFKKIFEDKKQPLYGRISAKIKLKPFSFEHSMEALKHLRYDNVENMLKIYSLFGGFPKYYASLEQFNLINKNYPDIIKYLFMQENAPLENEVADILKQEFGRRSPVYYSILHSVAIGKTKLSEIADNIHMKESSITRHLSELEEKFGLLKTTRPIDNKKNTRYSVNHPLIRFWFRFVYDKFSEYKLKSIEEIMKPVKTDFNTFFGKRFEDICIEFITKLNAENKLPFKIDYINNWWGSARVEGIRQEIEIDLIALNQKINKALFIECKWQDKIDAEKLLKKLREKAKFMDWRKNKREEYFCIIAKSFKKKIKEENVLLFDLKDIEKTLMK
ncbi:ATP-binding protein, partial [Candidatus Parcubacteria bacterium]|nr:ATP-binding protein [Candidatus Parcubacteria bacterium]